MTISSASKRKQLSSTPRKKKTLKSGSPSITKWFSPISSPKFELLSVKNSSTCKDLSGSVQNSSSGTNLSKNMIQKDFIDLLEEGSLYSKEIEIKADQKNSCISMDAHTSFKNISGGSVCNQGIIRNDSRNNSINCDQSETSKSSYLSFGLLRLASIPKKLGLFKPKKLDSYQNPILLKENAILGRSVGSNGKRKQSISGSKIHLGIPMTADGISRKHLKVTKIHLSKRSFVSFEVLPSVKNEFLVYKNGKWTKPKVNDTFELLQGDCIVFDAYEWGYNKDAKYAFKLVTFDNNRVAEDKDIIEIDTSDTYCTNIAPKKRARNEKDRTPRISLQTVDKLKCSQEIALKKVDSVDDKNECKNSVEERKRDCNQAMTGDSTTKYESMPSKEEFQIDSEVDCASAEDFYAGDQVDVRRNDGIKWYRGRVAKVNLRKNSCEIAYDDSDFEINVPIDRQNIRLVERGWISIDWVIGMDVILLGRSKQKWKIIGKIETAKLPKMSKDVLLELKNGSDNKTCPYVTTIQKILRPLYNTAKSCHRLRYWDSKARLDSCSENKSHEQNGMKITTMPHSGLSDKKNIISPETSPLHENGADSHSSTSGEHRTIKSSKRRLNITHREQEEMLNSQSNSLWRAISSTEPQSGFGILTQLALVYRTAPNQQMRKRLHNSLTNGLESEGIRLVDPNKTELTSKYATLVHDNFADSREACLLNWIDIENCFLRAMKSTARDTLLEAAFAIEYVSRIMKRHKKEIADDIGPKTIDNETDSNQRPCIELSNGIREALKSSVKFATKLWMLSREESKIMETKDSKKSFALSRCLKSLGEIVSILTWIFCHEEAMQLRNKKCSFLIRDAFESELFAGPAKIKDQGLIRNLKLSFIFSLKKDIVQDLPITLADVFGVEDEYSIITGF